MGQDHAARAPGPDDPPAERQGDPSLWDQVADAFTAWADGSASADRLVSLMTPVLWHVARACRLEEDAARDVLQDVWLALVRRRDEIANPRGVAAWLITATRREAWRVRSRVSDAVVRERHVEQEWEWEQVLPSAPSAEDVAGVRLRDARLWEAVATLPERCVRLLRVVAFSDRPDYHSLAGELGMPIGSIGPTRGRCLTKLRAALAAAGSDDLQGERA